MKGIVCLSPERLELREMEEPELQEGRAIVSIRRIGVCGTDLHAYMGRQPYFSYPRILGHELAGVLESVPAGVTEWKAGDQVSVIPYMHCGDCGACRSGKTNCCSHMQVLGVHADGGMTERISVPMEHLISADTLSLDEAALLEPLSIGAHAVRRSGIMPGQRALVIGAGPIGLGVMAFARLAGAEVIAMDVQPERLKFCKSWAGVEHTVLAGEDVLTKLTCILDQNLPDVVFDATGNAQSMMSAFDYTAHGGTLVYVGLVKGEITFQDPEFHRRELTLMGSRNATREDFERVIQAIQSKKLDVSRLITHRTRFEQITTEFEQWLQPGVIKAMIERNESGEEK
ncbi:alcohol dehydrogenase GroES domain protein [Paenibacillus algicola]|uniref:Alcohol dehydrogenase GroES domain protein n=1 Tax=Paenibacillus algicola TaxID=2565926 RepID=A0A4P8XM82_9BACL|nr:zinc-binding alcohol dehydrogenase family protein [Paenibacillus algicola]QCT03638.1 alcohol dehydrogenase GroES domain protein [Paenibacillus algicola]